MPLTIRTIGTHYYGRNNVSARQGACPQCRNQAVLTSYDTRLWFVILYLPIIPLGRKRIIDECSVCSTHQAIGLKQWETARQGEVSDAAARFAAHPTAEAAMEVQNRLLKYHEFAKAAEFRSLMAAQFPDDASVHQYLGLVEGQLGLTAEAARSMDRAHALQPDLPAPRANVAQRRIQEGRLEEARQLFDFLLQPGAAQRFPLDALIPLAEAFERQKRGREALEIYRHLLREQPARAQQPAFRQALARLEGATGERPSAFPPPIPPIPQPRDGGRKLIALAVIVIFGIVALAGSNELIRRQRTLYIVNGFSKPLEVTIAGQSAVRVEPHDHFKIKIREGDYVARISGPIAETVPFSMHTQYQDRWSDHPVWILNPGAAEILEKSTAVYLVEPAKRDEEGTTSYHYGERFFTFQDVDRPFGTLPREVRLSSGQKRTTLTSINHATLRPSLVHDILTSHKSPTEARRFAELRLRFDPDDEALLTTYVASLEMPKDSEYLEAFLREGLKKRPVAVPWHRQHQTFHLAPATTPGLIAEYDALIAAEPSDPALLYLRSLLCNTDAEARGFHAQAQSADPQHPYALFAQALAEVSRGEIEGALPKLEAAGQARPKDIEICSLRDDVRIATGNFKTLEAGIRSDLRLHSLNLEQAAELLRVLASTGRKRDALRELDTLLAELGTKNAALVRDVRENQRYSVHRIAGDLAEAEKSIGPSTNHDRTLLRMMALAEQGKPQAAMALPGAEDLIEDQDVLLVAMSIAWHLAGKTAEAADCREQAMELYAGADMRHRRAAALVSADTPATDEEIKALVLQPGQKRLVCVLLGQKFPKESARFFELARKLNFMRTFPHHLIDRATK